MNIKYDLQGLVDDEYGSLSTSDKFLLENAISRITQLEEENNGLQLAVDWARRMWQMADELNLPDEFRYRNRGTAIENGQL